MFGIFLLSNTCVWLQWLGFEGKHAMLCIRGFNCQALIRNLLVFQQFLTKSYQIGVFLQASCLYIWEILLFSLQKWPWATLLRVFCQILLISHKICMYHVKCISILYYVCVLSNHCIKLNVMPIVCLLSKLFILWHFHFKMSNSVLHAMSSSLVQ